ncbi:MAG: hypothetical protein JXR28_02265, partial [Alphaproteobacteria bacterium]|nr:hypothetical protein [Alphaproteobacteria bacterium]
IRRNVRKKLMENDRYQAPKWGVSLVRNIHAEEELSLERIKADNKRLKMNERRLVLNGLTQQSFESSTFYVKKLININSGQVFSIKQILKKKRLILFINTNSSEDIVNTLLRELYAFSNITKPVIITDALIYKQNIGLQKIDTTKIELYFSYVDGCTCDIPYKDNLFFMLDVKSNMNNIFIPSLYYNDINISYLKFIYTNYYKDNHIDSTFLNETMMLSGDSKKDTLFCYYTEDYDSLLKKCLFSNTNNSNLFVNLNKVKDRTEFITMGHIYPYLTFIDSNLNVISHTNSFEDLNIQNVSEEVNYFIASTKSMDQILKLKNRVHIIE